MTRVVMLDSGPLGLLAHPRLAAPVEDWVSSLLRAQTDISIPEIVYYELRRGLVRIQNAPAVERLDALTTSLPYEPVTKGIVVRASELWAQARREGKPTADDKALDVDVILAATGMAVAERGVDVIIATTNVGHLRRYLPAALWTHITP